MKRVGAAVATYLVLQVALHVLSPHVTLPNEAKGVGPEQGSLNAAVQQLLGRRVGTDFLADYASTRALVDGADPYAPIAATSTRIGEAWAVPDVNPHPPTQFAFVLPFTLLSYSAALSAWALLMVGVYITTLWALEVPLLYAVVGGVALAATFPGAYGIGNPVPLIGLGAALGWRWRDEPALAGAAVALATAPKLSGAVLVLPFLLTRRFRALWWAGGVLGVLATLPLFFEWDIWNRYGNVAPDAVRQVSARADNASLINLGHKVGVPTAAALALIGLATIALMVLRRDVYWPVVWLSVACLPIAWMYSLLTLVPLAVPIVWRAARVSVALVGLAAAAAVAIPPLGRWPVAGFPLVVALMFAAAATAPPERAQFWPAFHGRRGRHSRRSPFARAPAVP
jgi:hypothetical protein